MKKGIVQLYPWKPSAAYLKISSSICKIIRLFGQFVFITLFTKGRNLITWKKNSATPYESV